MKSQNEASSQPTTAVRWKADHDPLVTGEAVPEAVAIKQAKPARKAKNEASSQPTTAVRWKHDHDPLVTGENVPAPAVAVKRRKPAKKTKK